MPEKCLDFKRKLYLIKQPLQTIKNNFKNVTKRLTENNYKQSPTKDVSINHIDKSGQQTRLIL